MVDDLSVIYNNYKQIFSVYGRWKMYYLVINISYIYINNILKGLNFAFITI